MSKGGSGREARTKEAEAKAKANVSAFLKQLDKIRSFEDDDAAYENTLDEYVNNNSDGVACMLATDLGAMQDRKMADLLAHHNEIFPNSEPEQVILVEAVEGDINAKGKFGYTLLTVAVLGHDVAEVSRLLGLGARWDVPDTRGNTAWDKAYTRGYDDILVLFNPSFVRMEPVEVCNFD